MSQNMQDIKIGDVTISAIFEHQKFGKSPAEFFIGATNEKAREHYAEMEPFLYDAETDRIVMAFQSFLIRTPKSTILVDTCNGEDKFKEAVVWDTSAWQKNFHALGLEFQDIDYVMCTHLHIDHTGWNTRLEGGKWVPSFPNAKYIFARKEYEYWQNVAETGIVPPRQRDGIWQASCRPIVEAGLAVMIGDHYELDDYVSVMPTPGHSPGHYCVRIQSKGMEAIALGDLMHHPLQCREPDWSTPFCWDPKQTATSRKHVLHEAAENRTVLLPTHFPAPTACRVTADGDRYRHEFYADQD